ncbi:uncharacterized protein LOC143217309 [Lasioglossum baleicum]|uniref:uncharacterized protein LOC143217309 n=1 Tax=Lasioglossum baleicum TaxID=434251 RepID=UPI003FCDCD04
MSTFAVAVGVYLILHSSVVTGSSEQSDATSRLSEGTREAGSFTQLSSSGTSQQNIKHYDFPVNYNYRPLQNKRCPVCDNSVYPYCGEKLLHDACCCTDPYIHNLPYQCKLADCRFLHANNCREHRLIATCCCSDDYRSLLKTFAVV